MIQRHVECTFLFIYSQNDEYPSNNFLVLYDD